MDRGFVLSTYDALQQITGGYLLSYNSVCSTLPLITLTAEVVSYLLTAGANAEHRNSDGFGPRELAINAQHIQIAQMF